MSRFWFGVAVLLLMAVYQGITVALGAHVVGFELPPPLVFVLVSISPVLLLLANGLPALYSLLPNASGEVPRPPDPEPGIGFPRDPGGSRGVPVPDGPPEPEPAPEPPARKAT